MLERLLEKLNQFFVGTRRGRVLIRVLAVVVVFCTTYSLILPAITLEHKRAEENGVFAEETADTESLEELTADKAGDKERAGSEDTADDIETHISADDKDMESGDTHSDTASDMMGDEIVLEYSDSLLKAKAIINDPEGIPADAQLRLTQILNDTEDYNYHAYMKALNTDVPEESGFTADNTLLLDVAVMVGDVEFEPSESGYVDLQLEFMDSSLMEEIGAESTDQLFLFHLPIKEDIREQYESTQAATDIEAEDIRMEAISTEVSEDGIVSFQLDSLSTIAVSSGNAEITVTASLPEEYTYYLAVSGPNGSQRVVALNSNGSTTINLPYTGEYTVDLFIPKNGQETNCANDARHNDYNNLIQNHGKKLEQNALLFGGYVLNMDNIVVTDNGELPISLSLPKQTLALDFDALMDHAKAYGVVADSFRSNSNIRTNFATKQLIVQNENTMKFRNRVQEGNAVPFIIGEFSGSSNLKFTSDKFGSYYIQESDKGHVSTEGGQIEEVRNKEELLDKVDLLITRTLNQAADLSKQTNNMASVGYLPSNSELDLTAFADDTTIVLDATGLVHGNDATQNLKIKKKPGQKIVFNMYGDNILLPYDVIIQEYNDDGNMTAQYKGADFGDDNKDNNQEFTSQVADAWKKIIWNIPEATHIEGMKGKLAGVYLLQNPGSYFKTDNGAGWIVSAGDVENQNHWYAFPAADEPFEKITVKKVFVGVDSVSDIKDKDNYYIQLETYSNAQSSGTSHGKNDTHLVIKDTANASNGEIKYSGTPEVSAENHTVTYTWETDYLAVGNEHKLTEYNAKAVPTGGSAAIDPIRVEYQTRIINLDNSVIPHVVRWHDNPEKDSTNPDGNVSGRIEDAYGVFNVSNDPANNTATVMNYYADKANCDLTVIKRVRGEETVAGREYSFTVELTDENGNSLSQTKQYEFVKTSSNGSVANGMITFANDSGKYKANFTLSGSQQIVIKEIPKNWKYKVTEIQSTDYTTIYSSEGAAASGQLTWDVTETVTNVYKQPMSSLIVEKQVNDKSLLPSGFHIDLTDTTDNTHSTSLQVSDAVESVNKDGYSVFTWTIGEMPVGDIIKVEEAGWSTDGYAVTTEIGINNGELQATTANDTITITKESNTVTLRNTYQPIFAVKKVVHGTPAGSNLSYDFKLKVWNADGSLRTDSIKTLTGQTLQSGSDCYQFSLKDGENVAFVMDAGSSYALEETTEGSFETNIDREILRNHEEIPGNVIAKSVFSYPTQIEYVNTYSEPDGNLHAKKIFVDQDGNKLGLKGNDYQFRIQSWNPDTKAAGQVVATGTNLISGMVNFPSIEFDKGTSWYLISEVKPDNPDSDITYSSEQYVAKVDVVGNSGTFIIPETNGTTKDIDITIDIPVEEGYAYWLNGKQASVKQGKATFTITAGADQGGNENAPKEVTYKVEKRTSTYGLVDDNYATITVSIVNKNWKVMITNVQINMRESTKSEPSSNSNVSITYYEVDSDGTLNGMLEAIPTFTNIKNTKETKQSVRILKTDQTGSKPLVGAKFILESEAGAALKENLISDSNGLINLGEMSVGTYYLRETEAPAGYIPLSNRIRISVTENKITAMSENSVGGQYTVKEGGDSYTIIVPNNAGYELPSTGGSGTNLIYLLGSILIAGAGILLLRRRRRMV